MNCFIDITQFNLATQYTYKARRFDPTRKILYIYQWNCNKQV